MHNWVEQDYYSYTHGRPKYICDKCGASGGVGEDKPPEWAPVERIWGQNTDPMYGYISSSLSMRAVMNCDELVLYKIAQIQED